MTGHTIYAFYWTKAELSAFTPLGVVIAAWLAYRGVRKTLEHNAKLALAERQWNKRAEVYKRGLAWQSHTSIHISRAATQGTVFALPNDDDFEAVTDTLLFASQTVGNLFLDYLNVVIELTKRSTPPVADDQATLLHMSRLLTRAIMHELGNDRSITDKELKAYEETLTKLRGKSSETPEADSASVSSS